MGVFSDIDCAYVPKTLTENLDITTGSITASLTLACLWTNRLALADDILVNRRAYPHVTTAFTPKAISCSIVQFDEDLNQSTTVDGQWRPPKLAHVTVNYGVLQTKEIGTFGIVAESLEPYGDFIRQDYQLFRWGSKNGDPLIPEEAPGLYMPRMKLIRRIYKLTSLPGNVLTAMGKCNESAYSSPLLGVSFPVETLLYGEPSLERTISNTGTEGWNYTQQWAFNPNGWNKYWNPRAGAWQNIFLSSEVTSGTPIPFKSYPPTDFSNLLI